jgi:hypothetical protein
VIAGLWTYRSYLNSSKLVDGDAQTALSLIFGEGVFTLATPTSSSVAGTLDMGGGYVLDLHGSVSVHGGETHLAIAGVGRANTPTAGWEYDYNCITGFVWPNGVDQVPSILGTVIRAKPHNGSPAGVVASFIAVRQE